MTGALTGALVECVERAAARLELPPVATLHLPAERDDPGMELTLLHISGNFPAGARSQSFRMEQ